MPPQTAGARRSVNESKVTKDVEQVTVFSEVAMRHNVGVLEYSRTCQAAAAGMASGILGLTGVSGFVFYFILVILQALFWELKANFEWQNYFMSRSLSLTHSLISVVIPGCLEDLDTLEQFSWLKNTGQLQDTKSSMLRGNDKLKLSRSDLTKKIEEQQVQITDYENKLKDVIRAYKGLNAERNALQAVVEALGLQREATTSLEQPHNDVKSEASIPEANVEKKGFSEADQIETLKRSLGVLVAEKSRIEAAFRSDKKALLVENEALKGRLAKAADETEAQAEQLENRLLELRSKIKLIEGDREKELSDHGSVLAAVQQQYAKECISSAQLKKQIAELHRKLRGKEEASKLLEMDIASLKAELNRAQNEVEFWKKKAEKTPAIQMLESELQDVKESNKNEITELKRKLLETMNTERESRLHELEQRLQEMSVEIGSFGRMQADLQQEVDQLKKENKALEDENALLRLSKSTSETGESTGFESLQQNFIEIAQKLRSNKQTINFYELLGLEETSREQNRRFEVLKDEYEKYKLRVQAMLNNKSTNNDASKNTELSPTLSSLPVSECSSCAAAEGDLRHMRSVVSSLHDKLHSLETDYANAKSSYEEKAAQLQLRIIEMEMAQENSTSDLRKQMQRKVSEMESEMQKQRVRALDILAEKENELAVTRALLSTIRSQTNVDPIDPPQGISSGCAKYEKSSYDLFKTAASIDERRNKGNKFSSKRSNLLIAKILNTTDHSSSDVDSCSSALDEYNLECLPSLASDTEILLNVPGIGVAETRNIFYEQQLVRKEKQIVELRNAMRMTELSIRDTQQAALTKDLQHFEMVEKLKDEIRILEGKLKFLTVDANMEYLRNIFIQLLHCDSSSGRKHILKAIGAVLRLSTAEMRAIDKHSL
uniref:GRIP domain-containing protein n=1 Tax=Setaria digitata TaxID=48799 RepID=A0A915PVA6_9BILA